MCIDQIPTIPSIERNKANDIDAILDEIQNIFGISLHYNRDMYLSDPKFSYEFWSENDSIISFHKAILRTTLSRTLYFDSRKFGDRSSIFYLF